VKKKKMKENTQLIEQRWAADFQVERGGRGIGDNLWENKNQGKATQDH